MPEMPANSRLLQIGNRSPGSKFDRFRTEIADSLRRIFEIFPFFGRQRLETGLDLHCVAELGLLLLRRIPHDQRALKGTGTSWVPLQPDS
jgi:hypothetical protein